MTFRTFLSLVFVVRNEADYLQEALREATEVVSNLVTDYEIIVIDNASDDESLTVLKEATSEAGIPNLQVFALTKQVDIDTAAWVGAENALGDYVAVLDPFEDDIQFLPEMLAAAERADVVFAANSDPVEHALAYRMSRWMFNRLYRAMNGIDLEKEASRYRLLGRNVISFILQHSQPSLAYRHLPATAGFTKANLQYATPPKKSKIRKVHQSADRGLMLLVSTTRAPLRFATMLALFGALANLAYSVYVVFVNLFSDDVVRGWTSQSLQQSGMFFLISIVLFILGEYILHISSAVAEAPSHHIGQEFMSARMTRTEKLNVSHNLSQKASKQGGEFGTANSLP